MKKNSKLSKINIIAGVIAAVALTAVSYTPITAKAESSKMGGNPTEVVVSNDGSDCTLTVVDETICDGKYRVVMNGVPASAKSDLLEKIAANLDRVLASDSAGVKFINAGFVDADKYSYTAESFSYDDGLCWAASTSDMLIIGGWAQGIKNPLRNYTGNEFVNQTFQNEDDVFLYYASNFSPPNGDFQKRGIQFFFNGLFSKYSASSVQLTTESSTLKNSIGTEQNGLYPDIWSDSIVEKTDITNNIDDGISALDHFSDHSYGIEVNFNNNGGHAITGTGVVIDTTKTGNDKYVAIFIADSDNEPDGDNDTNPGTMQAAFEVKKARTNSYTMYGLQISEKSNCDKAVLIKGYLDNNKNLTFLESVTTLPFKSDAVIASATKETAANATKDTKNYVDFVAGDVDVSNEKGEYSPIVEGEKTYISFIIENGHSNGKLTKENSGVDVIENKIELIKDGQVYATLTGGDLDMDTTNPGGFNDIWYYGIVNTEDSGVTLTPGDYVAKLYVNTNNAKEAYVLNNTPSETRFTVVAKEDDSDSGDDAGSGDKGDDKGSSSQTATNSSTTPAITLTKEQIEYLMARIMETKGIVTSSSGTLASSAAKVSLTTTNTGSSKYTSWGQIAFALPSITKDTLDQKSNGYLNINIASAGSKVVPATAVTTLAKSSISGMNVYITKENYVTFYQNTDYSKYEDMSFAHSNVVKANTKTVNFASKKSIGGMITFHTKVPKKNASVKVYEMVNGKKTQIATVNSDASGYVALDISETAEYILE